jgi:hypothetical protein
VRGLQAVAQAQGQDPAQLQRIAHRLNLLAFFHEEARALEQAAALAPHQPAVQLERALSLLRLGDFDQGWPLYTWRCEPSLVQSALPRWQPAMACDQLLILPEQGLGDQIMLASMLPDAASLAAKAALIVDPRLRTLFQRSFPHLPVLAAGQPFNAEPFQAQIALGSLGATLRPSKAHCLASRRSYLVADPAKTQALRRRHHPGATSISPSATSQLLVGLSWSSASSANGVMKSLPLETLASALSLPGIRLLSLQYGDTRAEREALRRTTGLEVHADPEIDTFADIDNLAALIAACDLVVSVSNTTAHLAGALGQRTWLLIDSRLDWRWGLSGSDTLWYPNARLFRQNAAGDWSTPLSEIQQELELLRREGSRSVAPEGRTPMEPAAQTPHELPGAPAAKPPMKWVF